MFVFFTGTWILLNLPIAFPKLLSEHVSDVDNEISGIEMNSPHKAMAAANEFPCHVSEVGDIRTSWIGQKGGA